jgi:hypothetical protein
MSLIYRHQTSAGNKILPTNPVTPFKSLGAIDDNNKSFDFNRIYNKNKGIKSEVNTPVEIPEGALSEEKWNALQKGHEMLYASNSFPGESVYYENPKFGRDKEGYANYSFVRGAKLVNDATGKSAQELGLVESGAYGRDINEDPDHKKIYKAIFTKPENITYTQYIEKFPKKKKELPVNNLNNQNSSIVRPSNNEYNTERQDISYNNTSFPYYQDEKGNLNPVKAYRYPGYWDKKENKWMTHSGYSDQRSGPIYAYQTKDAQGNIIEIPFEPQTSTYKTIIDPNTKKEVYVYDKAGFTDRGENVQGVPKGELEKLLKFGIPRYNNVTNTTTPITNTGVAPVTSKRNGGLIYKHQEANGNKILTLPSRVLDNAVKVNSIDDNKYKKLGTVTGKTFYEKELKVPNVDLNQKIKPVNPEEYKKTVLNLAKDYSLDQLIENKIISPNIDEDFKLEIQKAYKPLYTTESLEPMTPKSVILESDYTDDNETTKEIVKEKFPKDRDTDIKKTSKEKSRSKLITTKDLNKFKYNFRKFFRKANNKVKNSIVDACTFKKGGILSKNKMDSCMCGGPLYKKKSGGTINIKPENKGKFTASAKKAGMGVQEFASYVLANKDKYSSTQIKRANFAKNASKWKH